MSKGQALQILSTALAMVEGTACIEPAGKAEKAIVVKSEALEPRAYGKAGRRKRPSQGGACMVSRHRRERKSERDMSGHGESD